MEGALKDDRGVVLAITQDSEVRARVEAAVEKLGFRLKSISRRGILDDELPEVQRRKQLTEPLEGSDGAFMRNLTRMRPALLLVDARVREMPWPRWTHIIKTSAATRRMPIVLMAHMHDERALERGETLGVNQILSLEASSDDLASCIQRWAHTIDPGAIRRACEGSVSDLAREGIELLNRGEFYQAHEPLEDAWMAAPEFEGYLYRALLQFAVACLHVQRGNRAGALKMTLRLRQWLDPLPSRCRGVDVHVLKARAGDLRGMLQAGQPLSAIDLGALIPIPLE
jgi:predicted metal-dependent hydrolase